MFNIVQQLWGGPWGIPEIPRNEQKTQENYANRNKHRRIIMCNPVVGNEPLEEETDGVIPYVKPMIFQSFAVALGFESLGDYD